MREVANTPPWTPHPGHTMTAHAEDRQLEKCARGFEFLLPLRDSSLGTKIRCDNLPYTHAWYIYVVPVMRGAQSRSVQSSLQVEMSLQPNEDPPSARGYKTPNSCLTNARPNILDAMPCHAMHSEFE